MNTTSATPLRLLGVVTFILTLFFCAGAFAPSQAYAAGFGGVHVDLAGVLQLLTPFVGLLLLRAFKTPRDHQRAALLAQIADDIAAVLVLENKGLAYSQLLSWIVARLREAGITANADVLNRVAAGALKRAGVASR